MIVTWTALRSSPAATCPWEAEGAVFAQSGHAGAGRAEVPSFDGTRWSVLAIWPDAETARAAAPVCSPALDAWHVVLEAAAFRGDAVLSGGARPFASLPTSGRTTGASAVVTLAGLSGDAARDGEFFERFVALGDVVEDAPGNRAALVQAPPDGAVLTFSAWDTLRSAVTWAYHRPQHAATVARQEEHPLLPSSAFLRCAVLSSTGRLGDRPDPLAGLTGSVTSRTAPSRTLETA
ncbi:MAG: hypothetical protein JWO60_384 [Frankiales bacterium]|nr:hypothetical protein [Frankiales bacterium]